MSHMLARWLRGIGMRRINTYSLLQDGRYMTQQKNGSVTPSMEIDCIFDQHQEAKESALFKIICCLIVSCNQFIFNGTSHHF
ncbi:hypothetical protein Sjap_016759 [Stephania japonica]|uniref:Uncharacterized protein n=1 Tax=Stephania japonica TaxID=461633 RepID=A0AAP0NJ04_9MAGN